MNELKLFNYSGVTPPVLRLAMIHKSLGDHFYRNPQFYGLEIFAMDMDARAYLEATAAINAGAGSTAVELQNDALITPSSSGIKPIR